MGIDISQQSRLLRKLALHAENMQSHVLHVGYLAAPDLFGVGSVFPMIATHRDVVLKIVALHRLSNEMSDLICGRTTHPINLVPGGLRNTPSGRVLSELREKLLSSIPLFTALAETILQKADALPDFHRETEFICLIHDDEYALYDGDITSTDGGRWAVEDYEGITNEFVVPYSTAKFTRHDRESYMVGALARFNLNSRHLSSSAREWASRFGLAPVCHNPFMNNIAQLVEFIHSVEDSISILDALLERGIEREKTPEVNVRPGRGIGAVDVPRGILFHDYTYDENGICTKANCVIPTNQNHNNINEDFKAFAPTLLDLPEKEIELKLEMLVRAYDPCISCSTHYLDVKWI